MSTMNRRETRVFTAKRLAILGDTGGRSDIFMRVLGDLGVTPHHMPDDLTILHMGDLVTDSWDNVAGNALCQSIAMSLTQKFGVQKYVQLAGNHDLAGIGGARGGTWQTPRQDNQLTAHMWGAGEMFLAAHLSQKDISMVATHAGVTAGFFERLGCMNAVDTTTTLNSFVGQPLDVWCKPGSLSTGVKHRDADIVWADFNGELVASWHENGDMPFNQFIGHNTPWVWAHDTWQHDSEWFAAPSPRTIRDTAVLGALRQTITHIRAHSIRSFDWAPQKHTVDTNWGITVLHDVEVIL